GFGAANESSSDSNPFQRPTPSKLQPTCRPTCKVTSRFHTGFTEGWIAACCSCDCKQHRVNFNARQMHKYPVCHVLDNSPNFLVCRSSSPFRLKKSVAGRESSITRSIRHRTANSTPPLRLCVCLPYNPAYIQLQPHQALS
ncbi:hypothetical protein PSTT_12188, partial [Puccinia striiformis]